MNKVQEKKMTKIEIASGNNFYGQDQTAVFQGGSLVKAFDNREDAFELYLALSNAEKEL